MTLTIRMIYPASQAPFTAELPAGIAELLAADDLRLHFQPLPMAVNAWPYTAGGPQERAQMLAAALMEEGTEVVWCARGGYGASDLLPLLPWADLRQQPPKWLVGFSDISCLHSGLFSQLGWPGIHGPMPGSQLWGLHSRADVEAVLALVKSSAKRGEMPLTPLLGGGSGGSSSGWLFGGCFSVLTNLIGTPYFPRSLAGAIVFWEDTGENPGRLMRHLNQWLQSGALAGVQAVIIGDLAKLEGPLSQEQVKAEMAQRLPMPVWSAKDLGHTSPNFPLIIGAEASLDGPLQVLAWHYPAPS